MSNILIIKHGSLGDIAQASGAIQDIFENHKEDQIYFLTTKPFFELFKKNPFIYDVILDKRQSRFNLIYLFSLMRKLKKLNIKKVYDLQNSSRTKFDKNPVLDRFNHQLKMSGLTTNHTMKPDFSWSCVNIDKIKTEYNLEKYILIFPFCSQHLAHKKWPYYNELIDLINNKFNNKIKIVVAPGPMEINGAKEINTTCILNNEKALDISQLSSLIKDSSYVVANDTGPAHMAAHLNSKGITLFGHHTSAKKVSIERENFKPIQVEDLNKLSANKVFEKIIQNIDL
jgi:ADP-heptose:LPS heptosyltransferase